MCPLRQTSQLVKQRQRRSNGWSWIKVEMAVQSIQKGIAIYVAFSHIGMTVRVAAFGRCCSVAVGGKGPVCRGTRQIHYAELKNFVFKIIIIKKSLLFRTFRYMIRYGMPIECSFFQQTGWVWGESRFNDFDKSSNSNCSTISDQKATLNCKYTVFWINKCLISRSLVKK